MDETTVRALIADAINNPNSEVKPGIAPKDAYELTQKFFGAKPGRWFRIGRSYLIQTVTYFRVGIVIYEDDDCVVLTNQAWVADTGRYGQALAEGHDIFKEVEKIERPALVAKGVIGAVDVWAHPLPNATK